MSCAHYTIRQRSYTSCVFLVRNINANGVPHTAVADTANQTSFVWLKPEWSVPLFLLWLG